MPQVLPMPEVAQWHPGAVDLGSTALLQGPEPVRVAAALQRLLEMRSASQGGLEVRWRSALAEPQLDDDESYRLVANADGVSIEAATTTGAIRALATLAQLRTAEGAVPCCEIADRPRYPWRGLMLDPARRFLPLADLLTVLDGMERLKMNVLHLHLSDDQGFRFPSARYPRLKSDPAYTLDELRTLVAAAAERGVRLVPELDVPGHVTSWLTAHPGWGSEAAEPSRRFGVHQACLDPSRPEMMAALGELLAEVADVFPDRYLHVGGDEVHPAWWQRSEGVQKHMHERGLVTPQDLQADFLRQVNAMAGALGRRIIGWDEVLHPQLEASVTVQSWRGATARDRALESGCDCVVSAPYYLDLFYPAEAHYAADPSAPEEHLLGLEDGMLDDARFGHVAQGMRWTHSWREPVKLPAGRPKGRVLGGEACLWGELVDAEVLPRRLWPRLPAIAERLWSPAHVVDVDDFYERIPDWCLDAVADELLALCEPVKWYGRLLGEVALQARLQGREMPQARPYDVDTRLDRPIDQLPAESLPARWARTAPQAELVDACQRWRDLQPEHEAELAEVITATRDAAQVFVAYANEQLGRPEASAQLQALYRPYGEYVPALALALWQRLNP